MTPTGEWLLTNGLGGYALGPRSGPPTRGYHGWLVAATRPPDGRMLLVGAIETVLETGGTAERLPELELAAGTTTRAGVEVTLEAWMPRDVNAIVLRWRRGRGSPGDPADLAGPAGSADPAPVILRLTPLLAGRDHHPGAGIVGPPSGLRFGPGGTDAVVEWPGAVPMLLATADAGILRPDARAIPVHYPEEEARGTVPDETLHAAFTLVADLPPGGQVTLVLGTVAGSMAEIPSPAAASAVGDRDARRRDTLLRGVDGTAWNPALAGLVLAADRFLVRRSDPALPTPDDGVTVIAGYPWFGDWGRDTMISLPGLALATRRHDEAARILRTWAGLVRDGLLPNHFPEAGGGEPAYHAIDAPLWFVHAVGAYERATGDRDLPLELRPAVEAIITAYRDGTQFGIGLDPSDGLVRGGGPGLQLTWMDAKVDGVVITPREGKPVEIQALWVEALRLAAGWARAAGDEAVAASHDALADRAATSFRARFVRPEIGWLADVVDGPDGDDVSLRPNQLLALSLHDDLVDGAQAASILEAVREHLLVPGGVRTLAPFEPGYRDRFQGPPATRDTAYHQGPAWTWLLGPWIDAVARHDGRASGRAELDAALWALDPDATGAIPELLEPEPPHAGRGCPWQAWGVAELLRCAVDLADA